MKLTCKETGCGATIYMGDGDGVAALLKAKMQEHMDREHGSLEARHAKTLENARQMISVVASGGAVSRSAAKQLHDELSDLVKKPRMSQEKKDANVSSVNVDSGSGNAGEIVSGTEILPPANEGS